jgi:putative membrane protein insertion efficiency factor
MHQPPTEKTSNGMTLPARSLLVVLAAYRRTLSPDHGFFRFAFPGGVCRFEPTCSDYAREAIEWFGAARGSWLALRRLLRCHPAARGGLDPIPAP